MARDGSGTYTHPAGTTAVTNTTIESAKYNAMLVDVAAALNEIYAANVRSADKTGSDAKLVTGTAGLLNSAVGWNTDGDAVEAIVLKLPEQSAATADTAAYGQIWVKNDAPNTLWFTNDAGTDFQLATTTSFTSTGIDDNATATQVTITDTGVGVGTTPSVELHVSSSQPDLRLQDSDGANQYLDILHAGTASYYTSRNNTSDGGHIFRGNNGTTITEWMRINTTGLGIGTTPAVELHVASAIPNFRLEDTDDGSYAEILCTNGNMYFYADASDISTSSTAFNWYIDGTGGADTVMQLFGTYLGIGTSTSGSAFGVARRANDGYNYISGGTSLSQGAALLMYGETHASAAGDWQIRASNDQVITYDYSASTLAFSATAGTEAMRLDTTGLAVNKTSAEAVLDIGVDVGNTAGSNLSMRFSGAGVGYFGFRMDTTGQYLNLDRYWGSWSATPAFTLDRSTGDFEFGGSIGIGDTPDNKLHVARAALSAVPALGAEGTHAAFLDAASNYGMLFGTRATGHGFIQQQRVDGTATAYDLWLQPNGGNVGVGTSSPDGNLHVQDGDASTSASAAADTLVVEGSGADFGISLLGSATANANIYFGDSDNDVGYIRYNHTNDDLRFGVGTAEAMRLNSTGLTLDAGSNYLSHWVLSSEQATTSGTSITWTSIPSWVREIMVLFDDVDIGGTGERVLVQLGDAGGYETTGYVSGEFSSGSNSQNTTGFVTEDMSGGNGQMHIFHMGSNTWCEQFAASGTGTTCAGGGRKTLSATLDRVRLIGVSSGTFTAGSAALYYR